MGHSFGLFHTFGLGNPTYNVPADPNFPAINLTTHIIQTLPLGQEMVIRTPDATKPFFKPNHYGIGYDARTTPKGGIYWRTRLEGATPTSKGPFLPASSTPAIAPIRAVMLTTMGWESTTPPIFWQKTSCLMAIARQNSRRANRHGCLDTTSTSAKGSTDRNGAGTWTTQWNTKAQARA